MKSNLISINDIARALGISPSTVSRALKDHPDISTETKRVVKEYADQVNYRPNALALSLKRQRSNTIGLVIPEIIHHFFSSIISGIEELAYAKGYRLIICQSNEDYKREVINTQVLLDNRVDGILVSMSKSTEEHGHFKDLIDSGIPLVFFDRVCEEVETDRVVTADFEGALIATSHLIERGCKKILHLASPQHLLIGKLRKEGYLKALYNYNISQHDSYIMQCDTRQEVYGLKDKILKLAPEIDGIFAVNDFTAIAVMQVLQENGYKIPDDIAVTGFGNDPIASIAHPPLTTVEQRGFEMGRQAVEILIRRIENPATFIEFQTRVIPVSIEKRASS
ncbi:MAG: LacI family DNA-binding transcriptional regulator [Lentimicrobiaceae bacterium]|nr:LacI family DNA-binding transcriptional regulator [Lentimicrobiaceae bacterium]MCB9024095.1 LacI family DNA-binding transcriptional regulator [Lentimicrobiaceae bacterium]